MLDYPILLKLLEYYQHYSPWLILALFLDAIFLLYINKKLHKVDLSRNNSSHQEILKTRSIGLMLFILAVVCLLSINLGLDEFDSMEGANAMVAKGITSGHALWFISFMLMFAHQPFYPLMLNLCIRFSGLENFGVLLRAVSVFWGVLTVYLTYKFSIKIFNSCLLYTSDAADE